MSIKTVLVLLTGEDGDRAALRTAMTLAEPFAAHVDAVLAEPRSDEVVYAADLRRSINEREELAVQRRSAAQLAFVLAARTSGAAIESEARGPASGMTASFRVEPGQLAKLAAPLSLFSDLVVLPPVRDGGRNPLFEACAEVLMTARCPVLLSAQAAFEGPTEHIAIGWDGSLSAAHALVAALPLLERQGSVQLLTVQRGQADNAADASEAVEYLALHGVRAEHRIVAAKGRISTELAAAARELGCGLLVLGAYGHSRTMEKIFGGVTDDIARRATLPVFLAH